MTPRVRRVLMTADTIGGVWTYALDLSRALAPYGVQVLLATMGRLPTPEQQREAAQIASLKLLESDFKLEWMDEPWEDVARAGAWLLELERRYAPDLVHLNGYVHGGLPFRAPVLSVGHSCVLSWWQAVKGEPAPARYASYLERVRTGLGAVDRVVAPSRAMLAALRRHYGPLAPALVLANGCDTSVFAPRAKRELIVAAGRVWDEAKNLEALGRAASALRWPLTIAGQAEPPAGAAGAQGAQLARFAPEVRFTGQLSRDALARELGHAAIYALPARYEPFGLSVLEAAAAGAALVLGDIPSLRELWEGAAVFVPPNDTRALVDAINRLTSEASLRDELARRARARARRFSLGRFGASYHALYRELALGYAGVRRPARRPSAEVTLRRASADQERFMTRTHSP